MDEQVTARQASIVGFALAISLVCAGCLAPRELEPQLRLESTVVAMQTEVAMELTQLRELVAALPVATVAVPSPTLDPSLAVRTPTDMSAEVPEAAITADILNLRDGPGLEYGVVGHLQRGDNVQVRARVEAGDWVKVGFAGGIEGWVATEFVVLNVPMADIPLAVQIPPSPTTGPTTAMSPVPGPTLEATTTPEAASATPQG